MLATPTNADMSVHTEKTHSWRHFHSKATRRRNVTKIWDAEAGKINFKRKKFPVPPNISLALVCFS